MRRFTVLEVAVIAVIFSFTMAFAGTAVKDGASVSSTPSSSYHRQNASSDTVVPTSPEYPLPTNSIPSFGTRTLIHNATSASDTFLTYNTGEGNVTMTGYTGGTLEVRMDGDLQEAPHIRR